MAPTPGGSTWLPVCGLHELPPPGVAKAFRVEVPAPRKPGAAPEVLEVAVIRGKGSELTVLKDCLPPLRQRVSGPHVAVDGRVLRLTCRGLGTHFNLRTGEVMGPWCPGPRGTFIPALFSWGPLLAMLLSLAARLFRTAPGLRRPQRLPLLRSRVKQSEVQFLLEDHRADAWPAARLLGRFLGRLLLPARSPRAFGTTQELEVRVRELAARPDGTVELKVVALDSGRGALRWPFSLRPAFEAGWNVIRLPDPHRLDQTAALARAALGQPDLPESRARVAMWISQFVEPAVRGRGVDGRLHSKMLDVLHTRGFNYLLFTVDHRGPELYARLREYYLRHGCVPVPEDNPLGISHGMLQAIHSPTERQLPNAPAAGFPVDRHSQRVGATLEEAVASAGIDLGANAFVLAHGFVCTPLLVEFMHGVCVGLQELGSATQQELAAKLGANEGPLSVLLRSLRILGFVEQDPVARAWRVVPSTGLQQLKELLDPGSEISAALRQLFRISPPFRLDAAAAAPYFEAWSVHRPRWRRFLPPALAALLDGSVLVPVIASLLYFHRWDEAGVERDSEGLQTIPCGALERDHIVALDSMMQEACIGSCGLDGVVHAPGAGALALRRALAFLVPVSYMPLLGRMQELLFSDASWGFEAAEPAQPAASLTDESKAQEAHTGDGIGETEEIHVHRTLNVLGSGAQHRTFFRDLVQQLICPIFSTANFDLQPAFVADTGCGDGSLLAQIYTSIRDSTPRGQALEQHPLTVVGIDLSIESRKAAAAKLSAQGIPHLIVPGDINDPEGICDTLRREGVDPARVLHVRSFLDHDRCVASPATASSATAPPTQSDVAGTASEVFLRQQFGDAVYLDRKGGVLTGQAVYRSLVEHLDRWGEALSGGPGLCLLEVMLLDEESTRRHFAENVAFNFDILSALSRQYLVPPGAFCMALAEAGLFSHVDCMGIPIYPESAGYTRLMAHHVSRRPLRARVAEPGDLDSLLRLEAVAAPDFLRFGRQALEARLQPAPGSLNLLLEDRGGRVLAAAYTVRLLEDSKVHAELDADLSKLVAPEGPVLQLLVLHADPERPGMGALLRDLLLLLSRVDAGIRCIVGQSRCGSWHDGIGLGIREHVQQHRQGAVADKVLSFHTARGARIIDVVPGARPRDAANGGASVLIRYDLTASSSTASAAAASASEGTREDIADKTMSELLCECLRDMGYEVQSSSRQGSASLGEIGLDSLELERLRSQLEEQLGLEVSPSTLLQSASLDDLCHELDVLRAQQPPRSGRSGRGNTQAVMSKQQIEEALCQNLQAMGYGSSGRSSSPLPAGFAELGLDSLELERLRGQLEQSLGIEVPLTTLLNSGSLRDCACELAKGAGALH